MCVLFLSNLTRLLVPLGFFVWSLFQPAIAAWVFMALATGLAGYLFFADIASRPKIAVCGSGPCAYGYLPGDSSSWAPNEIKILRRYHLALRFPFAANTFSCCLNGIRLSTILWVPWLLWNTLWIPAGFLILYFCLTSFLAVRLDPFFFLSDAVRRGKYQFADEFATLQQVRNRLNVARNSHLEPQDESVKEETVAKEAEETKVEEELAEKAQCNQPDFSPHPRGYGGC